MAVAQLGTFPTPASRGAMPHAPRRTRRTTGELGLQSHRYSSAAWNSWWAATTMTTTARLTLDQFLQLPEQEPALEFDSDGTIHAKPSPNTDHGARKQHLARLPLKWIDV